MTDTEMEEVVERLEAEVKASGSDPDDLGIVNKKEYQETQDKISEVEDENESLEEENSRLREEIETVKELYAESLGEVTGLEPEFFMDKDLEDLQDLHEEKCDEELVGTPDPASGDVTPEEEEAGEAEKEVQKKLKELSDELSKPDENHHVKINSVDELEDIIDTYERRGGAWASAAEPYREAYEEITS